MYEEPSTAWIFQCNPDIYDIRKAVSERQQISLAVKQHKSKIKAGDRVYIWESGTDAGVVAVGLVDGASYEHAPATDDPCFLDKSSNFLKQSYQAVDIKIEQVLVESSLSRSAVMANPRTSSMSIIVSPQGSNFSVTKDEHDAVVHMIADSMHVAESKNRCDQAGTGRERHYWLYAPGRGANFWDEFYRQGIMGIGWDDIGDLTQYAEKEDIRQRLQVMNDSQASFMNDTHALWQFANEIEAGDVVYAKRGQRVLVGRGVVESDYRFDENRNTYRHLRKVRWTHVGEWTHPGKAVTKTLTDITP